MDKKTTLAALAFCLATGRTVAAQQQAIDLKTLQLLQEEGVSTEEFERAFLGRHAKGEKPASLTTYSSFSLSDSNYSSFSLSDANYSSFSLSAANYSSFSLSDSNYSSFSLSDSSYSSFSLTGNAVTVNERNGEIPSPKIAKEKTEK